MSEALEKFLITPPHQGRFADLAQQAAIEIAKKEGFSGYHPTTIIDSRADVSGWFLSTNDPNPEELRSRLLSASNYIDETGQAIFFRGSKIPLVDKSSFHFEGGGVHVAPRLDLAVGYADGVNSDTGVGRLLRTDLYSGYRSLGFLSAWRLPAETRLWKNFEYEDYIKGVERNYKKLTAKDMATDMRVFGNLPLEALTPRTSDQGTFLSPDQMRLGELFRGHYYEAITESGAAPHELLLKTSGGQLIKINPANPDWDKWMARVYEANTRDLYEIRPLESALGKLKYVWDNHQVPLIHNLFVARTMENIQARLDASMNGSFKYESLAQANVAIEKMPWVKESVRVGSATGHSLQYSPEVSLLVRIAESAIINDYGAARETAVTQQQSSQQQQFQHRPSEEQRVQQARWQEEANAGRTHLANSLLQSESVQSKPAAVVELSQPRTDSTIKIKSSSNFSNFTKGGALGLAGAGGAAELSVTKVAPKATLKTGVGAGSLQLGLGGVLGGALAAANGGDGKEIVVASLKGLADGALPGVTNGFGNITENNKQQNWVDQALNAGTTATQGATIGALAVAGTAAATTLATSGTSSLVTVPTAAGFFVVAGVSGVANLAIGVTHDVAYVTGLSKQGGLITGAVEMVGAFAQSKKAREVGDWMAGNDEKIEKALAAKGIKTDQIKYADENNDGKISAEEARHYLINQKGIAADAVNIVDGDVLATQFAEQVNPKKGAAPAKGVGTRS